MTSLSSTEASDLLDPEAYEVLTMDFKNPENIVEFTPQYLGILHPFILDDLELIDAIKVVHTVHDEVTVESTMPQEQVAAYIAAFNATVVKPGQGIVFTEIGKEIKA